MSDHILDISEEPARLAVRHRQLIIERRDTPDTSLPLSDIAVVVVSHPQVSMTQAALSGLVEEGGALVLCDARRLPVGMLLPIDSHYVQTERFGVQARASLPTKKRLWRQVVQAKIRAQAGLLDALYGKDEGLPALALRVRSGDPSNLEAQASRRYWPALFTDASFRRNREAEDQNRLLNYGYAVLRAVIARAVCAAGLHPSLGIHHQNRYNSFCLADDLMEPLRPLVDQAVVRIIAERGDTAPLDSSAKGALLAAVTGRLSLGDEQRTVFEASARMASSLAAVFEGRAKKLLVPEVDFVRDKG
jgi:CRISPR-associated protein Cas1